VRSDFRTAAARRRVRRAARGNIEVARQQVRKICWRGDARRIAPAARAAVDILVVRAFDCVGARERLDRRFVLVQARQQRGEIVELCCNDMDDTGFLLQLAAHGDITRAHDEWTKTLARIWLYDEVDDRGLF